MSLLLDLVQDRQDAVVSGRRRRGVLNLEYGLHLTVTQFLACEFHRALTQSKAANFPIKRDAAPGLSLANRHGQYCLDEQLRSLAIDDLSN